MSGSDDEDEWSIEILDGDCVNAPAKSVKQTPPTSTSSNWQASKEVSPFFLDEFSTKAIVSGTHRLTGWETTNRAFDTHRTPVGDLLLRQSTEASHTTFSTSCGKKTRSLKLAVQTHDPPNVSPPDSDIHEQSQFRKTCNDPKSRLPSQVTRPGGASSSSYQSTSGKKAAEEESSLPVYSFMEYRTPPAVVYTKSESEADSLIQTLEGPLGFDLEWRVIWQRGAKERRTALVQLCDHRTILLIQVSNMKRFPRKVLEVIESADIAKTGANILNDGDKLFRDFGIRARGLVELGAFATKADDNFRSVYNREIVSLAKMVAMYMGRTLLKGKVRISNWEANLSQKMIEYAANDCHCALMVYDRLQEIATKSNKSLEMATYSCQVNPRSLKANKASLPIFSQIPNGSMKSLIPEYCIPEPPRPQQLRAYKLWHVDNIPLDKMCMKLRTGARIEPLKESTVISYVIGALQADPRLPFNMAKLKALVLMEAGSWQRHRQWIASRE